MQGDAWINLLRRIPANLHEGLVLTLSTGSEVVVQRFVKLDTDFAILRGRMAGTQDNGRLVVLPYSNVVSVNVTRRLLDAEIDAIFGKNGHAFAADIVLSNGESTDRAEQTADDEPANDAEEAPVRPAMPSKTELLKKLRARLRDGNPPTRG